MVDIREMHLETVFRFIGVEGEGGEFVCGAEGGEGGCVEGDGAQGRGVGFKRRERESEGWEVEVVGRAEEEDAFAGRVSVSVGGFGRGGWNRVCTILRDRGICRRKQRRDRNRSIRHGWGYLLGFVNGVWGRGGGWVSWVTDGAIMMRAPGWGMGDMPSMEEGTASSQLWSCLERVGPSSVYQEPAWLASRVVIVMGSVDRKLCHGGMIATYRWMKLQTTDLFGSSIIRCGWMAALSLRQPPEQSSG